MIMSTHGRAYVCRNLMMSLFILWMFCIGCASVYVFVCVSVSIVNVYVSSVVYVFDKTCVHVVVYICLFIC